MASNATPKHPPSRPTPPRLDVVVIGNVGVDTNVFHPDGSIDFEREANFTDNRDYVGQAGGYTSRGYAQLGCRTAFIGHVGDDFLGDFVRRELESDGIDLSGLGIDPTGTSRSVNLMFRDGGRKNFYDGKSHMTLEVDLELAVPILGRARLAHVHLPNWARTLLPSARRLGLTIACDLQDVTDPDDPYRLDFLHGSDILFFSAANQGEPLELLRYFAGAYPGKTFVMGMGAMGCAVGSDGEIERFAALEDDLPIVDTNGAGDGLAVGFLIARVLEGRSISDSVLRGQLCARHTCAQRASTRTLITRAELEARVRDRHDR